MSDNNPSAEDSFGLKTSFAHLHHISSHVGGANSAPDAMYGFLDPS
jgi:hypothetical protein